MLSGGIFIKCFFQLILNTIFMNFSLVPEIQTSSKEDALCESSNKRKWIRHLEVCFKFY